MRMTIVAGLILGASLAVQSMLGAHARAKVGDAVRVHAHQVAPWYIAMNDRWTDGRASRAACALASVERATRAKCLSS